MPTVFDDSKEEEKSTEQEQPVIPQISFVQSEVQSLVNFLNFVSEHGQFKVKPRQMAEYISLNSAVVKLAKKCENHIFEILEYKKVSEQ